jgi:hypothetical protein
VASRDLYLGLILQGLGCAGLGTKMHLGSCCVRALSLPTPPLPWVEWDSSPHLHIRTRETQEAAGLVSLGRIRA